MNHHLLTVTSMTNRVEGELLPGRLARAAQVAEARRGSATSVGLVGRLRGAIGAGRFGAGEPRRPIWRRPGVRPAPMVSLRGAVE